MPPFVKWLGGKGTMVQPLADTLPDNFQRYIEPMVGGGALFWHLAEQGRLAGKQVILNDANEWLMRTYQAVRDDVEGLINVLRQLSAEYDRRPELLYYQIRKEWNAGACDEARFLFLKATSFNGLWRVNRSGELNMPWGHYAAPSIVNSSKLRTCSQRLQGVELCTGAFSEAEIRPGDAVYCDPPYHGTFDSYLPRSFSLVEHVKLVELCAGWAASGSHVLYTHADVPQARAWLRELWPDAVVRRATVRRMVNCRGDGRTPVYDLIVAQTHGESAQEAV